jgi:transcriptional regulator GlxA family with amidase domain
VRRTAHSRKHDGKLIASTAKDIDWVPKARWVVDGNLWASSGVVAGADSRGNYLFYLNPAIMVLAFLEHLAGTKLARQVRGIVDVPEVSSEDDQFASWHGLV